MNLEDILKKICAVVVTYNRIELLKKCLKALQNQTYSLSKIIVIDNNSNDATENFMNKREEPIEYYRLTKNGGGAYGFNQGIRRFIEDTDDQYVWLMDDDTIPEKNALENIVNFISKIDSFGFVNSNVRWKDGSICKLNRPSVDSRPINDLQKEPLQIQEGTFVSLLMPREVILKIGLPYKEFFIWQDDIEYTQRASELFPSYWLPDSKVVHFTPSNEAPSIMTTSKDRINRYYYDARNVLFTRKTHRGILNFYWIMLIKLYGCVKIFFSSTSYKKLKIKTILRGIIDGIRFNPKRETFSDELIEHHNN